MLYTSAYYAPIIGTPVAISLYPPKGFKCDRLPLFAPSPELLKFWKQSAKDDGAWEQYKSEFRDIVRDRWKNVNQWLFELTPEIDTTLLCYKEKYCHRHLVGAIVNKYRPDCWGGEISRLGS